MVISLLKASRIGKNLRQSSLMIKAEGDFHRIQFTPWPIACRPDWYRYFPSRNGRESTFQSGPIFNSLILADEINRAPAKVQAAMLEAMAEKQVTAGRKPMSPDLFWWWQRKTRIEQEGTYSAAGSSIRPFLATFRSGLSRHGKWAGDLAPKPQRRSSRQRICSATRYLSKRSLKPAKKYSTFTWQTPLSST